MGVIKSVKEKALREHIQGTALAWKKEIRFTPTHEPGHLQKRSTPVDQ